MEQGSHQYLPKKRKSADNNVDVDAYGKRLVEYIEQKSRVSVETTAMGTLVEAAMDRLPYSRKIWFMGKLVELMKECNGMPPVNE